MSDNSRKNSTAQNNILKRKKSNLIGLIEYKAKKKLRKEKNFKKSHFKPILRVRLNLKTMARDEDFYQ